MTRIKQLEQRVEILEDKAHTFSLGDSLRREVHNRSHDRLRHEVDALAAYLGVRFTECNFPPRPALIAVPIAPPKRRPGRPR
jgi:hypothetical protein